MERQSKTWAIRLEVWFSQWCGVLCRWHLGFFFHSSWWRRSSFFVRSTSGEGSCRKEQSSCRDNIDYDTKRNFASYVTIWLVWLDSWRTRKNTTSRPASFWTEKLLMTDFKYCLFLDTSTVWLFHLKGLVWRLKRAEHIRPIVITRSLLLSFKELIRSLFIPTTDPSSPRLRSLKTRVA